MKVLIKAQIGLLKGILRTPTRDKSLSMVETF